MSINPRICPYLLQNSAYKITCKGHDLEQSFATAETKKAHYDQYCAGEYYLCPVAEKLNAVYQEYEDSPCPHNRNVLCFFKDTCHRCGWDPAVSLDRLKQKYPNYSERCLEKLLSRK